MPSHLKNQFSGSWETGVLLTWGLGLTLFLAAQSFSQVQNVGRSASMAEEQDYAFAYGLYNDGLYQLAAEQFDQFLKKYPASIKRLDAFYLTVECRFQQQQFDTAAKLFEKFLLEFPHSRLSDDALLRLGEAHLRLGKPEGALPSFKRILDDFSQSDLAADAAYWTGESFVRMGEFENGIKYYLMALEHYPDSRLRDYALYAIGWAYQTKKDYQKAIEWYKKLPGQFPDSDLIPASMVRVGECYFGMREYRSAIQELSSSRQGITRPGELGEALYLIAESYYHLAEFEEARKGYEHFLATVPGHKLTNDVVFALGWSYLKVNNFALAEATFDRLAGGSDPLAISALFRRGVAQKLGGKLDAALATWKQVLDRDPAGPNADNALYESALVRYERDEIAQAQALFERVAREFPSSDVLADAYRMLGECLVAQADFKRAQEAFAAAVAAPNASFEARSNALYQLGWSAFKLEEYRGAAETLTQFLEQFPGHPKATDARHWRGESSYRLNDYVNALKDFDAVWGATTSPRREEALYGAGYALFKQGDYGESAKRLTRLVADYPSGKFIFDARVRLADCYYFLKDYKAAETAYRTVLRQFPERADRDYAMYQLGQTHYRLGNLDDALRQFQGIITGIPSSSLADDAQYAIGWIWFQGKNYDEAIKEFRILLQKFPNSDLAARTLYSIGDAYYNQQNYVLAEQSYRDVLRRFSKSSYVADAISGIQYCLLAQGKQAEALAVIDAFVRENPESADARALLLKKGDLLFSQKQYEAAIREYRGFVERYSESPLRANAWFWIGKSYEVIGSLLDAATAFDRAAEVANATVRIRSEAFFQSGEVYRQLKSYDKANAAYQEAQKVGTGTTIAAEAAYRLGSVSDERGDVSGALQLYNRVIATYPKLDAADKAKLALARIYLRETNYTEAETLAGQVATSRTDQIGAEAQYLIGLQFAQQGDWNNAIPAYLRVRYIFPAHEEWLAKAALGLGEAYEATDDLRRAREVYQSVLRMERPKDAVAEAQKRLRRMEK
ncbi:MAG: tetratricopeptide repeat protein [Ignavibacteriales bacterium]|nr:tetratricopeptide repeat protein [Ignavibacteriales bacterium]